MHTNTLRRSLLDASTAQLEVVIDWLDRPSAPIKNDALRAAWHEARRSDGARRALAFAIAEDVRSLCAEADIDLVARRLELSTRSPDAIAAEMVRRLGGGSSRSLPVSPELVVDALHAIARVVVGLGLGDPRRSRGTQRGRRHRHGR